MIFAIRWSLRGGGLRRSSESPPAPVRRANTPAARVARNLRAARVALRATDAGALPNFCGKNILPSVYVCWPRSPQRDDYSSP